MPKTLKILFLISILCAPLTAWAADSAEEPQVQPADSAVVETTETNSAKAPSVPPVSKTDQGYFDLVAIDFLENDSEPLNMSSVEQLAWGRVCEYTCHPCRADYQCPFNQKCRSHCH